MLQAMLLHKRQKGAAQEVWDAPGACPAALWLW